MAYENFFATRTSAEIGSSDTTITLDTPPSVFPGRLALEARNATKRELIEYTGVSGNDITGVTRGVGGTSAQTHASGSLVEMNVTAEDLEEALNVPQDIEDRFNDIFSDFVASGLLVTDDTGLNADVAAGVAYINGIRIEHAGEANHAFTASRDTYVDLGDNGVLDYNAVSNGAAAPALAADHIRLARVVTDGSNTSSVWNYPNPAYFPTDDGYKKLSVTLSSITALGNRAYSAATSVDISGIVSPGTRLRFLRSVLAPTQCTDLEAGSSQSWQKTTPAGMAQTDDISIMGWVKLESYMSGFPLVAKRTGSNGYDFRFNSNGQMRLHALVDGSNYKMWTTHTCVPLNKWVHVAGTFDMSGNSGIIYFDGISQSVGTSHTGTANALTNATTLYIGRDSAGTELFDGKISQVAIFSSVLSAATIRSYMSQALTGAESTCVGYWSFNGNGNDSNANANHLSANGSAVATDTDSPFSLGSSLAAGYLDGMVDFGIVTAVDASNVYWQVPEGSTVPTSGGIQAIQYSHVKAPYGFPIDPAKWQLETFIRGVQCSNTAPTVSVWYNISGVNLTGGFNLTIPIGLWKASYMVPVQGNGATPLTLRCTLSTASNSESDTRFTSYMEDSGTSSSYCAQVYKESYLNLAAATAYYFNTQFFSAGVTALYNRGDTGIMQIRADLAVL